MPALPAHDGAPTLRLTDPPPGFAAAPHACAGMNVAHLDARIAIGALARRLPLALAGEPERDRRLRIRGFRRLPARLS